MPATLLLKSSEPTKTASPFTAFSQRFHGGKVDGTLLPLAESQKLAEQHFAKVCSLGNRTLPWSHRFSAEKRCAALTLDRNVQALTSLTLDGSHWRGTDKERQRRFDDLSEMIKQCASVTKIQICAVHPYVAGPYKMSAQAQKILADKKPQRLSLTGFLNLQPNILLSAKLRDLDLSSCKITHWSHSDARQFSELTSLRLHEVSHPDDSGLATWLANLPQLTLLTTDFYGIFQLTDKSAGSVSFPKLSKWIYATDNDSSEEALLSAFTKISSSMPSLIQFTYTRWVAASFVWVHEMPKERRIAAYASINEKRTNRIDFQSNARTCRNFIDA